MSLCFGCFEERGEQSICPHCGYDMETARGPLLLAQGVALRGYYVIGKILGKPGGFGITYLGYNQKLETKVAIKEYLPRDLVAREAGHRTLRVHDSGDEGSFRAGIDQFLHEARLLARFNHPNIVRVIDFFEENGTAYLVMDYYQGVSLAEYMERQGGALSEHRVRELMMPVLDGLKEVHAGGVLHRDIKPQNIYLTDEGRPILLDFGAAKQFVGERSRSLSLMATPGFASYEQYHKQGQQGPWTDIYGCAATMYYMLTGTVPPDAVERMAADNLAFPGETGAALSPEMRNTVMRGLALLPEKRVQTVQEFQNLLSGHTRKLARGLEDTLILSPADAPLSEPPSPARRSGRAEPFYKKTAVLAVCVLIALAAAAGGGYRYYLQTTSPVHQLEEKGLIFTEEAFFNAVRTNDIDAVKLFLAGGMSPNGVNRQTGETPMTVAIEYGQLPMVNFLITHGADLIFTDSQGNTFVDLALKKGHTQILKTLMDQLKLDSNSRDEQGRTLLERAVAFGNIASVKFLIEQGADVNVQNGEGKTLLDRVLEADNQQMAAVLADAGARRNINIHFRPNRLNEITLPVATTASFEVDLLGDGIGQKVTVSRYNSFRSKVTIFGQDRQIASFDILGSNEHWYIAYLRDDTIPDLIYFHTAGSGNFVNDFKIIGKTGKDTIGVIFNPDILTFARLGRGASLSQNGKQLILRAGKNKSVIEWSDNQYSRTNNKS